MDKQQEFHEFRLKGIGGSDAGAIAGLNPYKTPLQVYMEKRELVPPTEENDVMHWGTVLEPVVAAEYSKLMNLPIKKASPMVHPDFVWMRGNPDYYIGNGHIEGGLEIKTAGIFSKHLWGESGSDQIPEPYILQVQHYMMIDNLPYYEVAALIAGNDFRRYRIPRNGALIKSLLQLEERFWMRVLRGDPPPVTGSGADKELLKKLYPSDSGDPIKPTANMLERVAVLADTKKKFNLLESDLLEHENAIKQFMGESSIMAGPDFKISWKKSKDSAPTYDWERIARDLAENLAGLESTASPEKARTIEQIIAQEKALNTIAGKLGSRRFLTSGPLFKGDE
jgi:putative phage-type endonuclease